MHHRLPWLRNNKFGWASIAAVTLLAAAVLTATALLRGAEYDEAYSFFVTAGVPRPAWPATPFTAGSVRHLFEARASLGQIAASLRATDVHPPLYFWAIDLWRQLAGNGLFITRFFSVVCALIALAGTARIAIAARISPAASVLITLGCYGFTYTGAVARGFALAQAFSVWGAAAALSARQRQSPPLAAAAGLLLGAATATNYLTVFVAAAVFAWLTPELLCRSVPAGSSAMGGRGLAVRPRFTAGPGPALPSPVTARLGAAIPSPAMAGLGPAIHDCLRLERHPTDISSPRPASRHPSLLAFALAGFAFFLPLDAWFFAAQHASRTGQFPPFEWTAGITRLGQCFAGAILGALPLYVPARAAKILAPLLACLLLYFGALIALRWPHIGRPGPRHLIALAAIAPAAGLLLLGLMFNNTPIEVRYLAFATPFCAIILAGALAHRKLLLTALGCVQTLSIAGLLLHPITMQPARTAAIEAAALAGHNGLVMVPYGNDGVGVVGPFLAEAPDWLHVLVVRPETAAPELARLPAGATPVVLALLGVDTASRETVRTIRAAFPEPCWSPFASGEFVLRLTSTAGSGELCSGMKQ